VEPSFNIPQVKVFTDIMFNFNDTMTITSTVHFLPLRFPSVQCSIPLLHNETSNGGFTVVFGYFYFLSFDITAHGNFGNYTLDTITFLTLSKASSSCTYHLKIQFLPHRKHASITKSIRLSLFRETITGFHVIFKFYDCVSCNVVNLRCVRDLGGSSLK
jgi:hypothetical protein